MATVGRRERKKAATRQALADAALDLFIARGFDNVGVREVADAADVSTATLFKHFPTKESLVFDLDADQEEALIAAVRQRRAGESMVAALHGHLRNMINAVDRDDLRLRQYHALIQSSEALREYSRRMWLRHEQALTQAIIDQVGDRIDTITCRALAHFALEARQMLYGEQQPAEAAERIFALLENGWHHLELP